VRFPPEKLWRLEFPDPADERVYLPHVHSRHTVPEAVAKYKHGKRKALFGHVWGVGETLQGLMGIENLLTCMATDREEMKRLLQRSAEWTADVVRRIIGMGVDVVQMSDDWGSTRALMFSPKDWWELIFPAEKTVVSAARGLHVPVALHSDGYIYDILPGIVDMGVNILHPLQASAGMDQRRVKKEFGDRLCLYGGLDVTYTLPRGTDEEIRAEVVEKMETLKPNGGYIFCTSHSVQEDTALERVDTAYRIALENSAY
jgi:uroporphyrinogen decarboxylase